MNDNDKKQFQDIFNGLSDYYQREPLNTNALKIYFAGLSKYSLGQVQFAVTKHLQDHESGQFFPKIADFIKHIESRGMSSDEIIAEARLAQTPFGVMARIHIGHHDLNTGDPFYLKERAAEIKLKMPEWQNRASCGDYTDHEISRMLRHDVSPKQPFLAGLPSANNVGLDKRIMRIEQSKEHKEYLEKFEEKPEIPVNKEGQLKIAMLIKDTYKEAK